MAINDTNNLKKTKEINSKYQKYFPSFLRLILATNFMYLVLIYIYLKYKQIYNI